MEKYIFKPTEETMKANGKTQADLTNIIDNVLTRYGTVEDYIEPTAVVAENIEEQIHECNCDNASRIAELETALAETRTEMQNLDEELNHYSPLINFVKAMNAESLARIEALTKRAESAEMTASELSEFAELIEVAKKLKG